MHELNSGLPAVLTRHEDPGYNTLRPEWVILGAPQPDGSVMIFASSELSTAELKAEVKTHDIRSTDSWPVRKTVEPTYTLTVVMPNFVMIHAPTYADALKHLFTKWSPPEPGVRPAINQH